MKLAYRKIGAGQALIILHGLLGSSDNWQTLGKKFAEKFEVYLIDLRNHGHSPHSGEWNYNVMSDDLQELIKDNNLKNIVLMGHSMGGKVAMHFAIKHAALLDKLIVVDVAPKYSPVHHRTILDALLSINLNTISSRKEVEEQLLLYIKDKGTVQFLLKNLYWTEKNNLSETEEKSARLAWRFNLETINKNIESVGEAINTGFPCKTSTLFIRGEKSDYIKDEDWKDIQKMFPTSILKTIPNAGHWIHAEQPDLFYNTVMDFLE